MPLEAQDLRVVFVGNSFVYFNDLPEILARLLPGLEYEQVTPGGQSFQGHLADPRVRCMLTGTRTDSAGEARRSRGSATFFDDDEGFDIVVLQEQSCAMGGAIAKSTGEAIRDTSLAAVEGLAGLIKEGASKTKRKPVVLLFAGWAHPHGSVYDDFREDYPDFQTHHRRNCEGAPLYMEALRTSLGTDIPVRLLRVGEACAKIRDSNIELFDSLFVPDDLHTSRKGSYLAAWVFVHHLIAMGFPERRVVRDYIPGSHDSASRLHCDFHKGPPWESSDDYQLRKWPGKPPQDIDEAVAGTLRDVAATCAEP